MDILLAIFNRQIKRRSYIWRDMARSSWNDLPTLGAMLFALPLGIIAAIYLCEYKDGKIISLIRICISTLAGVPSIVFGLFGLAFLNTIQY